MTVLLLDHESELSACAAGDKSAFLALYRHEAPSMRALALAMLQDADRADDVLHETFVLIWRNAAGYSPALGTARAWMYSILRYRALACLHNDSRSGKPAGHQPLPEVSWPSDAPPSTVARVLSGLPAPQREALLQAYLRGGDPATIAGRLNRSEPDIQASIQSALRHIDEAIHA